MALIEDPCLTAEQQHLYDFMSEISERSCTQDGRSARSSKCGVSLTRVRRGAEAPRQNLATNFERSARCLNGFSDGSSGRTNLAKDVTPNRSP